MRLKEFKQPRQRIDEIAIAVPYIYALLVAAGFGGAMIASDPNTAKLIQRKIDQWSNSNPDQAEQYYRQIQDAQKSGALPKSADDLTSAQYPVLSAMAKTWDWLTGGSTTGQTPAQPDDYVKDKNGLLRRKDADVDQQVATQRIQGNILSNMTKFDNEQEANKALPYLKPGAQVTIGGKRMVVQEPGKGGKAGFVNYKDLGTVQQQQVKPHIDDIVDFSAGSMAGDDDQYTGTVSRPSRPSAGATDRKDWSAKPSVGTTKKEGPSFWDTIGGIFSGGKTDMAMPSDTDAPAPTSKKDWSAKPSTTTKPETTDGRSLGDVLAGIFGGAKTDTAPSATAPKQTGRTDWSAAGIAKPEAGGREKGKEVAPPITGPISGAKGKDVVGTQADTGAQTQADTQAQAQAQADTGTVAQPGTRVEPVVQATPIAQAPAITTPTTTTAPPPVTQMPPPIVPPAKPQYKTEPFKDQEVFYTGWRKGPPKKVIRLR